MQFLWDMNIESGMGAQEINFPLPYKTEDIFQYLIYRVSFVTRLFLEIVFKTVLKGSIAQNQCKDFPE